VNRPVASLGRANLPRKPASKVCAITCFRVVGRRQDWSATDTAEADPSTRFHSHPGARLVWEVSRIGGHRGIYLVGRAERRIEMRAAVFTVEIGAEIEAAASSATPILKLFDLRASLTSIHQFLVVLSRPFRGHNRDEFARYRMFSGNFPSF